MAVVTHGSFDEGPVVLALPPVYEYEATVETDPIFSAWDRSTGVSISHSQISDFDSAVSEIANAATPTGYATDAELSTAISDALIIVETDYVPYSGATGNIDVGTNTISAGRMYVDNETPVSSLELATKGYVDYIGSGGTVSEGIAHNDTSAKDGGGGGYWGHLSLAQVDPITALTDTDTATTPSGLVLSSKGIITGSDGTQTAYVILTWTATAYTSLDRYIIEYQKNGNLGWVGVNAYTNSVQIEGLVPGVAYNFRVYSVNKYGTRSTESGSISITMDSDSQAPGVTTVTSASGGIQMILVEWTHNTASDLAYYNVYRHTINDSGSATLKGNTKSNRYTDSPLPINTTYYYWVKAVDTSGNESSTFSSEVHATTKAVESSDITSISAGKVLITGTTYLSNWTGTDSTKINGAEIETGSVTLSKLQFTPGSGYGIIAAINAYEDGIQINASNINVVGATLFAGKVSGTSLSKVYIYPDSTRGLRITDDLGRDVFLAEIGGTNIGDVTIGDWSNGQGSKYDKSAAKFIFRGRLEATEGSISGIFDFGTASVSDGGKTSNIAIAGNHIWENSSSTDNSSTWINLKGYLGGVTKYRNTYIGDGRNNPIVNIQGGAIPYTTVYSPLLIGGAYNGATSYLRLPNMTTATMLAITKQPGMMVFNTTLGRFCGVVTVGGVDQWWTFTMASQIS